MTFIVVKKLVWNTYNTEHIKKHKVTAEEGSEAARNLLYHRKTYNNRYLAVGRGGKRLITFIIRRVAQGEYYLVTARDSDKKERKRAYEKEKIKNTSI